MPPCTATCRRRIRCPRPKVAAGAQCGEIAFHEAAHWLADHRGSVARSDAETVVESSAAVVIGRFGVDAGAYIFPFPYVAH